MSPRGAPISLRLIIKHEILEVSKGNPALSETVTDCMDGKTRVELFSGETLFLSGGYDPAIPYQASGTVMIEGGSSENVCRHIFTALDRLRVGDRSVSQLGSYFPLRWRRQKCWVEVPSTHPSQRCSTGWSTAKFWEVAVMVRGWATEPVVAVVMLG
jgi:hypothetical protein